MSTNQKPPLRTSTSTPLHTTTTISHESSTSIKLTNRVLPPTVAIPDKRRNSIGEHLHSPNETWRPATNRQQSWSQEDLKRECYMRDMCSTGIGFTEVVEEPVSYEDGK
ncbi:hypothetical protein BJ875DRAFT_287353 [Amylocarpus encephaloides]|uniref:Uncharacterized protein n=1 Tax=Amylocarpus encephaloides TaxID=45428 RepID=A0A9P7YJR4_9HELO|nr:hypothetical protein BJ875DRAFT_287353 [Amylocarpus encephaloides]